LTCIAAVVHDGGVWMGGDSAGVSGYDLAIRRDAKVFRTGEFLFGFTDSFRMGQLLRYSLTLPDLRLLDGDDVPRFMATRFVDAVRDCLKAGGYAEKHDDAERGGTFLVGFRGRLFRVCSDYQVCESADGYDAIGCGHAVAAGSLYSTRDSGPESRVRTALEAAERHNAGRS
jgi:hypothetical protein